MDGTFVQRVQVYLTDPAFYVSVLGVGIILSFVLHFLGVPGSRS